MQDVGAEPDFVAARDRQHRPRPDRVAGDEAGADAVQEIGTQFGVAHQPVVECGLRETAVFGQPRHRRFRLHVEYPAGGGEVVALRKFAVLLAADEFFQKFKGAGGVVAVEFPSQQPRRLVAVEVDAADCEVGGARDDGERRQGEDDAGPRQPRPSLAAADALAEPVVAQDAAALGAAAGLDAEQVAVAAGAVAVVARSPPAEADD